VENQAQTLHVFRFELGSRRVKNLPSVRQNFFQGPYSESIEFMMKSPCPESDFSAAA
jgi:hypothetical protein